MVFWLSVAVAEFWVGKLKFNVMILRLSKKSMGRKSIYENEGEFEYLFDTSVICFPLLKQFLPTDVALDPEKIVHP